MNKKYDKKITCEKVLQQNFISTVQ